MFKFKYILNIVFILILIDSTAFGNNIGLCVIALKKGECYRCHFCDYYLNELGKIVSLSFVVDAGMNNPNRFIRYNLPLIKNDYSVVRSDSLYEAIQGAHLLSQYCLYFNNNLVYKGPVSNIREIYDLLQSKIDSFSATKKKVLLKNDLLSGPVVYCSDNLICLSSHPEQVILLFDKKTGRKATWNLDSFQLDKIRTKYVFDKNYLQDSSLIKKYYGGYPELTSVFLVDNSCYISVSFPRIEEINLKKALIRKSFLVEVSLDSIKRIIYINENNIPDGYYIFSPQVLLNKVENIFTLNLLNADTLNMHSNVGFFQFRNDTLSFSSMINLYDSIKAKTTLTKDLLYIQTGGNAYGYMILPYLLCFYNSSSNCEYFLMDDKFPTSNNYIINDIFVTNDKVKVLLKEKQTKSLFLKTIDRITKKQDFEKIGDIKIATNSAFLSDTTVIFLSPENDVIESLLSD